MNWLNKPYYSFDAMLKERFGEKVYKVALDGGMSCPNRDGTLDTRGCIFCSTGGSGDFAGSRDLSISRQIETQKEKLLAKRSVNKFIAYFQAYTNTYAPVAYLESIFTEAAADPDVAALSIGTRPDCLGDDVLDLLSALNKEKPIWIELGLQTVHEDSARYIRRGYDLNCFETAVSNLQKRNLEVITHIILGLPGETQADMIQTIQYLNHIPIQGIKLHLLHILQGTDLASEYENRKFSVLSFDDYLEILISCLEHLSPEIVIHRLTGDGPKNLLIAPEWSSAKRTVLNELHHRMKLLHTWQGRLY